MVRAKLAPPYAPQLGPQADLRPLTPHVCEACCWSFIVTIPGDILERLVVLQCDLKGVLEQDAFVVMCASATPSAPSAVILKPTFSATSENSITYAHSSIAQSGMHALILPPGRCRNLVNGQAVYYSC
jgi:hypothetical protein